MGILGNWGKRRTSSADAAVGDVREPVCGVCGLTAKGVARRTKRKDPSALIVGKLVGVCPNCKHAYCKEHALAQDELEHCPICCSELDFGWDEQSLTESQEIRIGAPLGSEG